MTNLTWENRPDDEYPDWIWRVRVKKCTKCNQKKTAAEFYDSDKYIDGLMYWCMECQKDYVQRNREEYPKHHRDSLPNVPEPRTRRKWCPDCRETKDASEFHRNKRTSDGLAAYCKEDSNRRLRESRKRNKY
jgi:hypothetical protein